MASNYKVAEKKKSLFSHFLKFSFGGWISAAISFLTTPVITALVLPDQFGKASLFLLVLNLLLQVAMMGTDQSFVRFFYIDKYRDNTKSLFKNSIVLPIAISLIIGFIIIYFWKPISLLLIDEESFKLSVLLAITLVISVLERYSTLLIRMFHKATLFSILKIIQSIATVITIILYAHYIDNSFLAIIYGTLLSLFIVTILAIYFERVNWDFTTQINAGDIKSIIHYGLPFLPTFLIGWVFEGIDKLSLRNFSTFEEIGMYTAASKIVAVLTILQSTFSTFWVPVAYEAYEKNSQDSKQLFTNIYGGLSTLFFLVALTIITFKEIIILFFDSKYHAAATIMPFLVFMPIMYTLSEVTVGGINFKQKTYWHLIIASVAAVANIIGVWILVPEYGAKGAALSTGIAYIIFFYLRTLIANYYFPLNFEFFKTFFSILVLFTVAFINTFYPDTVLNITVNMTSIVILILFNKSNINFLCRKLILKV